MIATPPGGVKAEMLRRRCSACFSRG